MTAENQTLEFKNIKIKISGEKSFLEIFARVSIP